MVQGTLKLIEDQDSFQVDAFRQSPKIGVEWRIIPRNKLPQLIRHMRLCVIWWNWKVFSPMQTWERSGLPLWKNIKTDGKLLLDACLHIHVCKGGALCNRISTWRETQALSNALMRSGPWSESDGVPQAHHPLQKVPPDTLCYLQVSWDQPMNHVTRWFPG